MVTRSLRIAICAILSLSALFVTGCKSGSPTIKIASVAPMTGQLAKMGEDVSRAIQLAVDEWNSRGGLLGKKIELLVEDDRADPKDAVSVADKVVAQGVIGVIGHYNSSCTIPASNIYHENNVVMVTPASTNPMVTDRRFPNVFRTCGRDDQQGGVEADFAVNVLKAKTVAILHDKTTYGQGLADQFKGHLPADIKIVLYEGITLGDKDFTAILTRAKSENPELLMYGGMYGEGGLLAKQMKDLEFKAKFLSGDGVYDPEFIRIAGPSADGTYLSYAPSPDKIPTAQRFIAAFKARWPEVGPYSIFAYDAANVILTAIQKTNSTDGAKLSDYIHNNTFDGAIGQIAFDAKGDPVKSPYVIWQVQNGALVQLDWTPSAESPVSPVRVETH